MNKRKSHAFGKDIYLLGADDEGTMYWLEEPTWDCGWYWGFGYIETYTHNLCPDLALDINSHGHFKCLSNDNRTNLYDGFKKKFQHTPLANNEIWLLCELMKSYYTLRDYADMCYTGGAHYTGNPCAQVIKNENEYNRINQEVLPRIFAAIRNILDPECVEEQEELAC